MAIIDKPEHPIIRVNRAEETESIQSVLLSQHDMGVYDCEGYEGVKQVGAWEARFERSRTCKLMSESELDRLSEFKRVQGLEMGRNGVLGGYEQSKARVVVRRRRRLRQQQYDYHGQFY